MKVMCRFYDSSDCTILPEDCYESDEPILRFYPKSFMKVISVSILRFFRFYTDFLQWMKERGIFVAFMYSYYVITFMTILR